MIFPGEPFMRRSCTVALLLMPTLAAAAAPATLARLKTLKPTPHPELGTAFVVRPGDVQVVLVPPPDLRRAVEELLPNLPKEMGGASTRPLTRGFRWAAVGAGLTPKLAV